jgi:hypothetical protein
VISFRYHLVSVIGIFLAIALGVVIGTSALNGAVVGDLRRQVSDLKSAANTNSATIGSLRAQSGNADLLAKNFGARIAAGALTNVPVVIVGAPGVSADMQSAIAAEVTAAGGKVAGRVQLSKAFSDPTRAADIRSLATSGAHPIGLQLPSSDDAGTLAGALLGYVLLGKGQATDVTQVLAGFSTLNMAKAQGVPVQSGKVVLFVTSGGMAKDDPAGKMLLSMVTSMGSTSGPTVVVGDQPSATSSGLVGLVRADSTAKESVSTVDNADRPLGRLAAALAAADSVAGRKGNFGTAAGADALLPGISS